VGLTCHTAARLSVGAGERSWVVNAGDSWRACFLVKDKLRGPVDSPMAERFVGDGSHFFCSSFLSFSRWRDTYFHVHVLNRELVYTSPETDR
jgi:hypothetical protein